MNKIEDGGNHMKHSNEYLTEAMSILTELKASDIEKMVDEISNIKRGNGRLFCLGVGGNASTASHAVNDFRKICNIESYCPTDNVTELTAITNDRGWKYSFRDWLIGSKLSSKDGVFVFSVGGGDALKGISSNIVFALRYTLSVGAKILGIVGRDGGYTAKVADACIIIPVDNKEGITPHTESFQVLLLHLIVSHPRLKEIQMTWEYVDGVKDE